jgi:hypothetical protein
MYFSGGSNNFSSSIFFWSSSIGKIRRWIGGGERARSTATAHTRRAGSANIDNRVITIVRRDGIVRRVPFGAITHNQIAIGANIDLRFTKRQTSFTPKTPPTDAY